MDQDENTTAAGHPDNLADVPTAAEYVRAFKESRDAGVLKSTGGRSLILEMLRANYQAPDHTIVSGELADHVDLPTLRASNLRYGNFAKDLCKRLSRDPKVKLSILVKFGNGKPGMRPDQDETIEFTLLPQVVAALEETWFAHLKPD